MTVERKYYTRLIIINNFSNFKMIPSLITYYMAIREYVLILATTYLLRNNVMKFLRVGEHRFVAMIVITYEDI